MFKVRMGSPLATAAKSKSQLIIHQATYSLLDLDPDPRHLKHLLLPMNSRMLSPPPQTLAIVVQRHSQYDRQEGHGELRHVDCGEAVCERDVEDPVGEAEA